MGDFGGDAGGLDGLFGIAAAYAMMRFASDGNGAASMGWQRRLTATTQRRIGWATILGSVLVFMVMAHYEMAGDIVAGGLFTIGLYLVGCSESLSPESGPKNRVWTSLALVGLFSYSIYLIHSPTEKVVWTLVVSKLGLSRPAAFIVLLVTALPAVVAVAYALYLIIERRSQEWSKHVSTDPTPGATDGRKRWSIPFSAWRATTSVFARQQATVAAAPNSERG